MKKHRYEIERNKKIVWKGLATETDAIARASNLAQESGGLVEVYRGQMLIAQFE